MYIDPRRCPVNFEVGDRVYLKVSPWKGVISFGKRGKLAPMYVGPFKIMERVNDQAVVLELPAEKCKVYDDTQLVPLSDLRVDMNQKLVEEPVRIVDRKVTKVRKKEIHMVLVEWKRSLGSNLTWETEELMKALYPQLFDYD
ncbi:uncharacterized protein [Rutidosis leptorrhynchoides]|uniref:uncharacterized protein n=1 Tax=Rutidosis leptorrhynchoides TaxID=125765 RepID=UPI003A993D72